LQTIEHAVEDVAETLGRMKEFYRHREHPIRRSLPVRLNELVHGLRELTPRVE